MTPFAIGNPILRSVGISYIHGTVHGPTGKEASVRFLIDSGATYSLLPEPVWQAIGLVPKREMEFVLADGTTVHRPVWSATSRFPRGTGTRRSSSGSRATRKRCSASSPSRSSASSSTRSAAPSSRCARCWSDGVARDSGCPGPARVFWARCGVKIVTPANDVTGKLTRAFRRVHIVHMAVRLLPGPFTVDAYHRMAELGVLDEDHRVELLDGQIVEMTPIGGAHAACVIRLTDLLTRRTGSDTSVSVQNPVVLGERWEPQPDIAVLRRPGGLAGAWLPSPSDVLLVVEVADTSLERDRDVKIPRYAAAGIPEAWLVDLVGDAITVCREPCPGGYSEIVTLTRGEALRPLRLPGVAVAVAEVLG